MMTWVRDFVTTVETEFKFMRDYFLKERGDSLVGGHTK